MSAGAAVARRPLACALLGLLAVTAVRAQDSNTGTDWPSIHVETGAGVTGYKTHGDGIWYQAGNPHQLETRPASLRLGLTGDGWPGERAGLDWRADVESLGAARSRCLCTPRDDYYDTRTHAQRPGAPVPNADYRGAGRVLGVELAALPYLHAGDWKLGAVAGVFLFHATWREDAYGWEYDPKLGAAWGGHLATNRLRLPRENYVLPVVGLFVQRGPWSLNVEYFDLRTSWDRANGPALYQGAAVVTATYQW